MKLDTFINRPVLSTVISIFIVLLGLIGLASLPITQFPDIAPPTISVSTTYSGANAQAVLNSVIAPLEESINGAEGMTYMESTATNTGSARISVYFKQGFDPDMAAVDVQNRVAKAANLLPSEVNQVGVLTQKRQTSMLVGFSLYSPDSSYDGLFIDNYMKINVIPLLQRVSGVGDVMSFGADYSMRIWLKPDVMAQYGLMPTDIAATLAEQNVEAAPGAFGEQGDQTFQYTMRYRGRLVTPEEFENIVVRANSDGSVLYLKDVADVELGKLTYGFANDLNGMPSSTCMVFQTAGTNATQIINDCKATIDKLALELPEGLEFAVLMDNNEFLYASIHHVIQTLIEAFILVFLVTYVFLQDFRSTIIPAIAIPVALIGTFFGMSLIGFSLNLITLSALVLAIAIVVDDAIVVVEDCSRLVDEGKLSRRQAAEKAMTELTGPVIGEVLVLLSVFIPTAFVSGITGQLYKQFALTIAVSTAFSGFNALTFTPAMCALFLTPRKKNTKNVIYRVFNKGYAAVENFYKVTIGHMLDKAGVSLAVFFLLAAAGVAAFLMWPTSYVPEEDQGYFMSSIQLPEGASLERTEKVVNDLSARIKRELPEVADVMAISGFSFMGGGASSNMGSLFVVLKPWGERKKASQSVYAIIDSVNRMSQSYQEAIIFSVNPPTIQGLGMSSGLEMQLLDINNLGATEMMKAVESLEEAVKTEPAIESITSLYQGVVPQYRLDIDRDKVKLQGLSMSDIFSTLSAYMGGSYVNDFTEFGRVYQVTLKGDDSARGNIDDVLKLSVRNASGDMVPFTSFTTIAQSMGEPTASRYNMYPTASITANVAKGVSSSDGIKAMERLVHDTLGGNYAYSWTGQAYQETQSGTTVTAVFIFAIILTLLVLAAQYESWTDPVAVVLSMPVAILGTVLGCMFMSQSISIYTQIGLILLLGLSAKNAILIVEYATYFRKSGLPVRQSALDAGVIRFRPIMMTAIAFIFGVMPMMFAHGAGAESRVSLGSAVVFGMLMNAVLGTLFVPNFWELMQNFQEKVLGKLFKDVDTVPAAPTDDASNV